MVDDNALSFSVKYIDFGSVVELPPKIEALVVASPFALVITHCRSVTSQQLSDFAAHLVELNCRAVYSRGLWRDNVEYAVDTADVLRELGEAGEENGPRQFIITASTDNSVAECLFLINGHALEVGVVIIATQTAE